MLAGEREMAATMRLVSASLCAAIVLTVPAWAVAQDGKLLGASVVAVIDAVEVSSIAYLSDGLKVKGYLAVPRMGSDLPCVIYNRGGNREFGALNDRMAGSVLARIASWGYVVAASQYRGNAGGDGKEEFGGQDVNDIVNLLPLLKSLPQADAARVGMYGWSRGGMMTYLALARTDRIAAAVVVAGLADLSDTASRRPEMERGVFAELIPDYARDKDAALAARSVVRWAEKLHKKTPILVLHGTSDWRIHPSQALAIASRLYESRHPFRFVLFEGGEHGLTTHRAEVDRLVKDWLDAYVRDGRAWPSLEPHGH
jgi:dipeptidyl aminopeptidase/acylaminoacyl peptidase